MKTSYVLIAAAILASIAVLAFLSPTAAQGPSDSQIQGAAVQGSDSNPSGSPEVRIPAQYQPDSDGNAVASQVATVYFTPQDENTSTTVLFLYNTGTSAATVGLETFDLGGGQEISTAVSVPAAGLVRICGDTVETISATWQDVVYVNFTTFSTYGRLTLPPGVHAEAYVVWNGSSTYDPLQVVPTLPIRFSTEPPTVFLPITQN